jgi:hypothetical protein
MFLRTAFCIVISFEILFQVNILAQGVTDLYLFNLVKTADGQYHVHGPKLLSGFNPGGYTNQPFFTAYGDLLVSVRKAGEMQNDIWLLSPNTKKYRQLTNTKSNEYSPQLEQNKLNYSVVRQVEGEPIDQQVFQFPVSGGNYESLTPDIKDIGYYAWLKPGELALYRIEKESNRLVSYMSADHKFKPITTAVGRTLISDGKGSVYYVHKFSDTYWYLKKFSNTSAVIDIIAETPSKSEDFALAQDGTFFMGKDQKLMYLTAADKNNWKECADLSAYGIHHITRMALSPDGKQLAIVATRE